jgi:ribosome biogenesis protein BRX1
LEAHQTKKQQGKSSASSSQLSTTSLVEIGPRFVLNPIRIFRGSFGGQTLFQNPNFVSPNEIRSLEHQRQGHVYEERKKAQEMRKERQEQIVLPEDPLDSVFR